MVTRFGRFSISVFFMLTTLLLPLSASAASVSVSPTSLSLTSTVGANVPSRSVQVNKVGNGRLRWSVVAPTGTWLGISPTSGTNSGALILTFSTSALPVGSYQTSFQVTSDAGSAITVTVQLNVVAPAPAPLVVSCPANKSVTSSNGSPVVVTYSASTSGGVAPVTVTSTPASGSFFPVGTMSVLVTAYSSNGQTATCGFSVTVTYALPPSTATGPQSTVTCPASAIAIWPGTNIQPVVTAYAGTTIFCLKAGVHSIRTAITPKTGNIFVGEYGAILDGTGWTTTDPTQAAFRAHNQDIDDVTIRNLVIRNMPQRGIHAYYWMSDRWTIEYNEIAGNLYGLLAPNNSVVRNNFIHHNGGNPTSTIVAERGGGYLVYSAINTTFESNEIAYNSTEQKVVGSTNVTFRNNFVHHNVRDGIWYDGFSTGALIEGNRVEDNGRNGIFHEISSQGIIRNNTVRRSGDTAIFIATSKYVDTHHNTVEDNWRGITYYLNCGAVGTGSLSADLSNNTAHDNTVRVGTRSGSFANGFSYLSTCTATQVAAYVNGSKNLKFTGNMYFVPTPTTKYWLWAGTKYWSEWVGLGQDLTGLMSQ